VRERAEDDRWIGESGLTATNVIGPPHLGPLALCAGVHDDASTDFPKGSLGPNYSRASPQPLPRDFSCAEIERAQAPSTSRHQPA